MPWRLIALPSLGFGSFVVEGVSALRGTSPYAEVPPVAPSLRVVAEAALDRTFRIGMNLLAGVPHPATLRRAHEETRALSSFLAESGFHDDPASFHRTPDAPHAVELEGASWRSGIRSTTEYQELRFQSGYTPHPGEPGGRRWLEHPKNGIAHAQLLEHPGEPRPWVVCIHGFGMGSPGANFALFRARRLHEELGWNVMLPCLPLHGERGAGRVSGSEMAGPDYQQIVHLCTQAAWDARRVIAWIRARGGSKIAVYGISLGAHVSALVASLEEGLSGVVAGIPAVDFPNAMRDNEPWVYRSFGEANLDWAEIRAATHVISPLALEPRVPKERRYIFAGTADRVAKPDQARALWRHWDRCTIHWFSGGHVAAQLNSEVGEFAETALGECLR